MPPGKDRADRTRTSTRTGWIASPAVAGAVVVGMIAIVAAFVMTRVEPALVGAPLLLAAALGWDRRPRREAASTGPEAAGQAPVDVARDAPAAGRDEIVIDTSVHAQAAAHPGPDGTVTLTVAISATATQRPDALQLRLTLGGSGPVDAVLTPRAAAEVSGDVPVVHSGRQRVAAVAARAIGADAAWVGTPGEEASVERVVRPRRMPIRRLPLPARLLGLTGQHISTRPGDGGEFRDVDLFHPGDRLRRIDWRATPRAGPAGGLDGRRPPPTPHNPLPPG